AARGGAVLDSVAFGMQAADFSIARIPDVSGNWTLGLPTLQETGTNQPALLGLAESLRFNEWMSNPLGTDDWFELFNTSGRPVDLSGLFLSDDATQPSKYRIPALSYLGSSTNGYLRFWADNDSPQGPTHVNFRLNDSGEPLVLSQTDLTSLLKVTFGPQARGISEGLLPDGDTTIVRQFGGSGSPGARNFLPLPSLRVLEVTPSNPGDTGGALEILNLGETETSLEGWWLTDDERRIRKYQFTSAAKIPAQSVLVLQLAEINANLPPALHLRLDRMEGGQVMLLESDSTGTLTGFQVSAEFGPLPSGVSVGWQLTAGGPQHAPLQQVTLGSTASNAPVRTGPVIISEVHYHPPDLAGTDNSRDEFVELHNVSSTSVILRSTGGDAHIWRLRDAVDYEFPSGTTLQPGQFALVVSFDPQTNGVTTAAFRQRLGVPASTTLFGPFVGKLDNSSDSIELARRLTEDAGPNEDPKATPETVADRVRYRDVFPWPSLADGGEQGRGYSLQKNPISGFGNDAATWVAAEPTPGRPGNSSPTGLPQVTQQPQPQTVLQGLQTTLSVTVNSNDPLSYQWFHNGLPILQGTNRELARVFALDSDAGEYQVLVGNRLGSVFSAGAKIILGRSPGIKASPKDQFVATGSQASFTVEATGGTPLAYQWFRSDVALSTATDRTLVIAAASAQDEGRYRVRISNPFG
ncbi:MAG: hypothetical protein FJ405_18900, partial [Verrucomicrobia bacterium]|nr:hypothetical protein [Verrucomicrobiota bacterium]